MQVFLCSLSWLVTELFGFMLQNKKRSYFFQSLLSVMVQVNHKVRKNMWNMFFSRVTGIRFFFDRRSPIALSGIEIGKYAISRMWLHRCMHICVYCFVSKPIAAILAERDGTSKPQIQKKSVKHVFFPE